MSTPEDLLGFAEYLIEGSKDYPKTDAYRRAVVNRLYYSAFHAAKGYHASLASPGSVGMSNGIHQQLISSLDNPTIPKTDDYYKSKAISKSLKAAIVCRVKADYELKVAIGEEEFKEAIFQCKLIFEKIH